MCHLILMLPVLGLPVFWLWPLSEAVPVYGVILALSILVYIYVIRAMRQPVETGAEQLLHSIGKVIGVRAKDASVRVHSEIWRALSAERLKPGDQVEIVGIDGLKLQVRKHAPSPSSQNRAALHAQKRGPSGRTRWGRWTNGI